MTVRTFDLEVRPRIPPALGRLEDLAANMLYSWDRGVRNLFNTLDPELWEATDHSPRRFLRRVGQERLDRAAEDPLYLRQYHACISSFDAYLEHRPADRVSRYLDVRTDIVAYFCAEFGFHESLPIYSGGLGILAGDHCKAASDLGLPFVAVGLLYRHGYFQQLIDHHGNQTAHYVDHIFDELPVFPVREGGAELRLSVPIDDHSVTLRVWEGRAGSVPMLLLDTDLPENGATDRFITYQLYGGDATTRIRQEMVLGIGGVRALRATGHAPTVWHINEGHAAFSILERCRELVETGIDFDSALEAIAASTVFTTHTPVPAGHDVFHHDLVRAHFGSYVRQLGIDFERLLALGASPGQEHGFNQTALAIRGSRHRNGVSELHGRVASEMYSFVWPQVHAEDNPVGHVTNGVHVQTFLHPEWIRVFDEHLPEEWRNKLADRDFWSAVRDVPDRTYWATHQAVKSQMIEDVLARIERQARRNHIGAGQLDRLIRHLNPETLMIGFARRFATYKRATLLLADPDRLARLVNDSRRPVVFLFAGKAHPRDEPGQDFLRRIYRLSHDPRFEGRIVLLEGYDLALGRSLVAGVDVWLNTPQHPLEASGTSGQKAAINGVPHLSVLDGWWYEGYEDDNGWAVSPHVTLTDSGERDAAEAGDVFDLLENHVVPLYHASDGHGYSTGWVATSKRAMMSALARFSAQRMVLDYVARYYGPASRIGYRLRRDDCREAAGLVAWRRKVETLWPGVSFGPHQLPAGTLYAGDETRISVALALNGLDAEDVRVECLVGEQIDGGRIVHPRVYRLVPGDADDQQRRIYENEIGLPGCGRYHCQIRAYPWNPNLAHRFELGRTIWL